MKKERPSFLNWWWNDTSHVKKLAIPFIWTLAIIFYVRAVPEYEPPMLPWVLAGVAITFAALGIVYLPYYTYRGLTDDYFNRNKFKS